jgi:hypothetical protein
MFKPKKKKHTIRNIIAIVFLAIIIIGLLGGKGKKDDSSTAVNSPSPSSNSKATQDAEDTQEETETPETVSLPTCDGINVTTGCMVDGVTYSTYIYHPAIPSSTHIEKVTTTEDQITGYCTLCGDGTYSDSTGKGTCSHHGGVAQYNYPIHSNVNVTTDKEVTDPGTAEYYEKVVK